VGSRYSRLVEVHGARLVRAGDLYGDLDGHYLVQAMIRGGRGVCASALIGKILPGYVERCLQIPCWLIGPGAQPGVRHKARSSLWTSRSQDLLELIHLQFALQHLHELVLLVEKVDRGG
jgi:hypothetical protein